MAATWYNEQPKNRNFLIPVGFKLDLEIFHGVDFFCQSASIPDISMPFAQVQTPFRGIPIASSGGVDFGDLSVRFMIDEELKIIILFITGLELTGYLNKELLKEQKIYILMVGYSFLPLIKI